MHLMKEMPFMVDLWEITNVEVIPSEHRETPFYCESHWAMAPVDQRSCGLSILEGIQMLSGCGPEQPAVGDPAWAGRLNRTFSISVFQPQLFYDSLTSPLIP